MKRLFATVLVLAFAPLVILGCEADPVEPQLALSDLLPDGFPAGLFSEGDDGRPIDKVAVFTVPAGSSKTSARKWIGSDGGRLELHGFAIDVPAGAVSADTEFSIQLPANLGDDDDRVIARFGPSGATFAEPVGIEFPFAGTSIEDAADPGVVWWNDEWVDMGGAVTEDGKRLRTTTGHFSTYGTTEERGGGGEGVVVAGG